MPGAAQHLPRPPPTPSPTPGKALLLSPSLSAPRTPQCSREPQAGPQSWHQLLLGVLAPRCWAHTCELVRAHASRIPWHGCQAGFALASVPWGGGWLWGRAAGAEPRCKGLSERWPRAEPVSTVELRGSGFWMDTSGSF